MRDCSPPTTSHMSRAIRLQCNIQTYMCHGHGDKGLDHLVKEALAAPRNTVLSQVEGHVCVRQEVSQSVSQSVKIVKVREDRHADTQTYGHRDY